MGAPLWLIDPFSLLRVCNGTKVRTNFFFFLKLPFFVTWTTTQKGAVTFPKCWPFVNRLGARARLTRYATDGADQEGLTPDEPLQMPFGAGLLSELESQSDESRIRFFFSAN
uniref:(northern house mosquito) hypothetical protein n=1 Tax=Culex pipiens TaxID=7175 RepID=A0A8D8NSF4_CULPI